jgi:hypothetical protein
MENPIMKKIWLSAMVVLVSFNSITYASLPSEQQTDELVRAEMLPQLQQIETAGQLKAFIKANPEHFANAEGLDEIEDTAKVAEAFWGKQVMIYGPDYSGSGLFEPAGQLIYRKTVFRPSALANVGGSVLNMIAVGLPLVLLFVK